MNTTEHNAIYEAWATMSYDQLYREKQYLIADYDVAVITNDADALACVHDDFRRLNSALRRAYARLPNVH